MTINLNVDLVINASLTVANEFNKNEHETYSINSGSGLGALLVNNAFNLTGAIKWKELTVKQISSRNAGVVALSALICIKILSICSHDAWVASTSLRPEELALPGATNVLMGDPVPCAVLLPRRHFAQEEE